MIVVKNIVEKANELIAAGGLTKDQIDQLIASEKLLDDASALSVATVNALPAATNNRGRIYYVTAEQRYYFSDGTYWRKNFTSAFGSDTDIIFAFAWGRNDYGRLGDNTLTARSSPVTVVGGITNWSQVSAGGYYSLGVTSTGIAYAWGRNDFGQLGDNTIISKTSPVTVVGGITNWNQVSAGLRHSLGLTSTGIAYAWGSNSGGILGDNTTVSKSSPVTVVGGITAWSQLSAGSYLTGHNLGVTSTGIAYGWGNNSSGRLGDNTTTGRSSPVTVVGGITTWRQISAGDQHSLGVTSTGIAYGWGNNGYVQIGDNTTTARSSPVTVVGGITNWSQVSAARRHSLGVTSTGIAYAWGNNANGQLGDNTLISKSSPITVVGGIANWSRISGGYSHSLGVTTTGIAYAWGNGLYGRLGDGTTTSRLSPVTVVGGITAWSQISAGRQHSLAIAATVTKGFL